MPSQKPISKEPPSPSQSTMSWLLMRKSCADIFLLSASVMVSHSCKMVIDDGSGWQIGSLPEIMRLGSLSENDCFGPLWQNDCVATCSMAGMSRYWKKP